MTDVNAVLRRDRAVVIAAITTISVLAWAYTLWLAAQMGMMEMPAPTAGSGSGTK
jgi:predicted metal-binding membrane protein